VWHGIDRNAYEGGAMWTQPPGMARVMADEGAEIGKKVMQWANM